ncbi:MAG: CoB--CoM heterodisulfide reductase iron-sulfur subunit B family protein [Myxococcota bacterium]|nr:CoB--CoM heterodisulfide reductase iron-sulfur subunit B family protein [Myxococcota bacterium]
MSADPFPAGAMGSSTTTTSTYAVSYYPGCSADGTGVEYDLSARAVCEALGIELRELHDWTCCGASSAHALDDFVGLALPARNLSLAESAGLDLVVPCAACFNRLRGAAHRMAGDGGTIPAGVTPYAGRVAVRHLLEFLAAGAPLEALRSAAKRGLGGLPVVPYYGCLTVRPAEVTGAPDAEDPTDLDRILGALGADVRRWPYKTRCCGAALTLPRSDVVADLCGEIVSMARRAGAEAIVVACPLCFMNLDRQPRAAGEAPVPVFYFTELAGLAMDLPAARKWLPKHLVDPRPVLAGRGIE